MWIGFRAQLRKPFYADSMWFFLWTFLWVTVHEYWQILKTWWTHESIIWTSICLCHEAKGKIYLTYIQHRSNVAPCQTAKILLTPHAQANLLPISLSLKAPNWQVNGSLAIHVLVSFGSIQLVPLLSSSTRTAGHSAAFLNHVPEIFGGDLQKQGPRHGSALGTIANISFSSPKDMALTHLAV